MNYQRNYGNSYGGCYHANSTQNRMMPHNQRMPEPRKDNMGEFSIAMAYVPWQVWGNLYDTCDALGQGTIFKDLNLRFCG